MDAADPTDPQTWNRYAYIANRPNDHVDPSGLDPLLIGPDGTILGTGGVGVEGSIITDVVGAVIGGGGASSGAPVWDIVKRKVGSGGQQGQIWSESQGLPGGMTLPRPSVASVLGIPSVAGPGCDFAPCVGAVSDSFTDPNFKPFPLTKGVDTHDLEDLADLFHRLTYPLDLLAVNATFFVAGGAAVAVGGTAIALGCIEPTPAEPLTCAVAVMGGAPTAAGGVFLIKEGVSFFKNQTLPAIKNWGTQP